MIGLSSVAVSLLPGSSSGQRVVVTGMGVVSPFGTDKEAMGGEEGRPERVDRRDAPMMQLLETKTC